MTAQRRMNGGSSLLKAVRLAWLVLMLPAVLSGVGCGRTAAPDESGDYGTLPGLRGTSDQKLRDELARIVDQQGTPELLMQADVKDAENVATGLWAPFSTEMGRYSAADLNKLRNATDGHFPKEKFTFNALRLKGALKFAQKYESQRRQGREALGRPRCDFGFNYVEGFTDDQSFVDLARICGRLEAFHAARCLFVDQDPTGAVESLGYQLRLAECLGAEKLIEARLEAAQLRAEALGVLRAITDHAKLRRVHLARLREIVHGHLKNWPSDADAWIGDRALGMLAYEIVRDGGILMLLTPEEMEEFSKEGTIENLPDAARNNADQDELYYLVTMREVIEQCKEPFHARADLAEKIEAELHEKRDSLDYPIVAGRMLLRDLGSAIRLQAEDRAAFEAWTLALDLATGNESNYHVNPMNGKRYLLRRERDRLEIWLDEQPAPKNPPDVVVPILAM